MEKFVPVVVIKELSETDKILTALKASGINCAEITFRTACAAEAIAYACKNYPEMSIGAGTVINADQCRQALEAGAQFIVSPGLSVGVAEVCKENNIPWQSPSVSVPMHLSFYAGFVAVSLPRLSVHPPYNCKKSVVFYEHQWTALRFPAF